jgi:hypothetical protein
VTVIQSGVYQMSFRGLTLAECMRFGGVLGFPLALLYKIVGKKGGYAWLPVEEAEAFCERGQLSADALAALEPLARRAAALGYTGGEYKRVTRRPASNIHDIGAWAALHADRQRAVMIAWIRSPLGHSISVTASFMTYDYRGFHVVNHHNYLDDGGLSTYLEIPGADLDTVAARSDLELRRFGRPVALFPDVRSFTRTSYTTANRAWEGRIQRGLYRKLSGAEEARVLRDTETRSRPGPRGVG